MKYRKLPVVVEAHQWFKNGDHPQDFTTPSYPGREGTEGAVVRRYWRTDEYGTVCAECCRIFRGHGWIDTKEGGHIVCPGDWIITGVKGERYPCKPDIFVLTYEVVEA